MNMLIRSHFFASLLLLLGLLTAASVSAAKSTANQYADEIAQAEELGKIIYEKDIAAWVGTDKMLAELGNDLSGLPIRGWVTDKDGKRYRVNFIGEKDGEFKVYYQAWTKGKKVKKSKTYEQGIPLNTEQMTMWTARQLVAKQDFEQCSKIYNTVVVPYEHDDVKSLYVYLFASTTDPAKMVIGGHYRYEVSLDGTKILSNIAFSNGCMEMTKDPNSVMFLMGHLKTNYPQEHHVFVNLSHGFALMVDIAKEDTTYTVSDGKIRVVSDR